MSFLTFRLGINRTFSRLLSSSAPRYGLDSRDKRAGHIKKKDNLEGEQGTYEFDKSAFDLIDENIMDKVINNVKFKDIPILHIVCTRNNTKISLTRGDGTFYVNKSAGTEGYKHCRKGTTVAAQAVANRVLTCALDLDIDMARLVFNGLGPGRGAAYKVFELSPLKIVSLSDRTQAVEPWKYRPRKAKRL